MPSRGRCAKRLSERGLQLEAVVAVVAGQLRARGPSARNAGSPRSSGPCPWCRRNGCSSRRRARQFSKPMPSLNVACVAAMNSCSLMSSRRWKVTSVRDGRLADADGADLVGFDQPDVEHLAQRLRQRGGHHPARRAAARDDDAAYSAGHVVHGHACLPFIGSASRAGAHACRAPSRR